MEDHAEDKKDQRTSYPEAAAAEAAETNASASATVIFNVTAYSAWCPTHASLLCNFFSPSSGTALSLSTSAATSDRGDFIYVR
jgi:hypothetical protein